MDIKKINQTQLDQMLALHAYGIHVGFRNIDYQGLDFKQADLSHINFSGSLIDRRQLEGCKLTGAFITY